MIDEIYITNYCDKRCSPLCSITRLPKKDAFSLAKMLSQNTTSSFTSFSRFCDADFDGYYKKRLRTEKWLYEKFIALGGKPENAHPLYFVLQESKYLNDWYADGLKTKLLLSKINPADISFTYGDSMSKMDTEDRMNPFTKESLFRYISKTGNDAFAFLNELNNQNRYIEAQLWNDIYIAR
jgi:hypothetical protein